MKMNGSDVMYDKRSQIDYEDSRSCALLYAKDTATFNEGHSEMNKSLGKTIFRKLVLIGFSSLISRCSNAS